MATDHPGPCSCGSGVVLLLVNFEQLKVHQSPSSEYFASLHLLSWSWRNKMQCIPDYMLSSLLPPCMWTFWSPIPTFFPLFLNCKIVRYTKKREMLNRKYLFISSELVKLLQLLIALCQGFMILPKIAGYQYRILRWIISNLFSVVGPTGCSLFMWLIRAR